MNSNLKSWSKRFLAWMLTFSMVAGLCVSISHTSARAEESNSPVLLTGEQATKATELLYEENFDYENATLQAGENEAYNLYVPSGATAKVEDGKLYFETTGSAPLYILGGEMWGYYTVEADITYATEAAAADLCFYVQNENAWSEGSLTSGSNGATYRMKVVANGTTATMYYAPYTQGVQGNWSEAQSVDVAVSAQSGSVGFAMTPAEGAESAAMYIDNIKVTRNMDVKEAKHTLMSVNFDGYTSSTTLSTSNTYKNYYIKTSSTGISVKGSGQKLHITGDGNGYGVMYFDVADAVHWDNYVVEVDMCQTNDTGFGSLLYRVQNLQSFQSGGLYGNGTAGLKGYWNGWANDGDDNGILHETSVTDAAANEIRRLKIVVNEDMADLYVASYTDNDNTQALGEWEYLMSIDDIADHHEKGSVGFLTAEGASFWIDNLEVYEYTTTYYEDFNGYEDVTLAEGADASTGLTVDLNAVTDLETASSVALTDGAVVVTGNTTSSFDMAWLTAGTHWTNYTYEADVTPVSTVASGWHGLAYRVESRSLWQRAGMRNNGALTVLNELGYCKDEKFKTNSLYEDRFKSDNIGFGKDKTLRVKVVVENNCTWVYSASYNATTGILGPYSLHAVLDTCKSFTGSVGMVVAGARAVTYDNIVVSATTKEAGTTNIAEITVPKTGIVNPSVVVTKVDANNLYKLDGTAVAIMDINSNLDIVSNDHVIGSVSQFMNVYGDTVIPAFYIDSEAEVTAICEYLKENVITDAFYVTDDAALLKSARDTWGFARGILEYKTMPTDHAAARREINSNLAMVVILPEEGLSLELVTEYHARLVSVWSYAENAADVYKGIAAGYAGMITSTPETILDVYESITTTTLSGEPIAIGHQGGGQDAGYPGNSIECYRAGVELGSKIIEVDPKMTKDGHIIMLHDTTLDRETTGSGKISEMTLEEIRQYTLKGGYQIVTFEETLEFLKTTDAVMQIDHSEANAEYMAAMSALIAEYGLEDQVCAGTYRTVVQNDKYTWTNSDWGEGIPIIGGELWISKLYDSSTTKEEYIDDMIHTLARYNHQQKPFDYNEPNDIYGASAGNNLLFYDEETLSYEVAARGFLNMQSATDTVPGIDKAYITQRGTSIISMNTLEPIKDYCYQIQAEDEFVKLGDALELTQTVTKIQGTADVDCKVQWLSGDAIAPSGDSYTMNKEGSATLVYYADITQERSYGDVNYRIYSEPVTITWNEDGKPDGIDWEAFAGKKVSILGDSVSTYASVSNNTSYNTTIGDNYVYYNATKYEDFGVRRPDTWWQQAIDFMGMELCVNNSSSSTAILTDRPGGRESAYEDRCVQLHNDNTGEEPDVIWLKMGDNDFSYYPDTYGSADAVDYDSLYTLNDDGTYTYIEPTTVYEAYVIMLHKMQIRYEGAEIYCFGLAKRRPDSSVGQPTEVNAGIKKVAQKMGCTYVDLENTIGSDPEDFNVYYGDGKLHPNALGMDVITKTVMAVMLDDPNAACRIMTDLTEVTSSSTDKLLKNGSSFETTLTKTADDLEYMDVTVTMGGEDITAQCYADGKISIASLTGDVQITAKAYGEHTYTYDANVYYHWEVCSCGDTRGKAVHTPELVGQKDVTETEAGYTGDKVCSVCDYVIEQGDVIANNRFAGYTYVTPEDYGFTYDTPIESEATQEASVFPEGTLDKTVFTTKMSQGVGRLVYLRDIDGIYYGLTFLARNISTSENTGYWYLTNNLPEGSDNDKIYQLNSTTGEYEAKNYININAYSLTNIANEFELAITLEYCCMDEDGINNDVKMGIWLDGQQYVKSKSYSPYFYLKDCVDRMQPGLRLDKTKGETAFKEPTYIVPPHTHTYGEWRNDQEGHWHVCTSCGKVADQTLHVETLVGYKEATATENGYTGDKVCETCGYVIEQGETTYYREWAGYRILTPKDFGFAYDTPIPSGDSQAASVFPEGTLDKTVFITKMNQGVGRLTYLQDIDGIYYGLTFLARDISTSENTGYWYLTNNLPEGSGNDTIYQLNSATGEYTAYTSRNIKASRYTNLANEFELAITLEYCCMDGDGINNDVKMGIWLDGQQYVHNTSYAPEFYLKDCVDRIQPGLRLDTTKGATAFIDPTVSDITIQPTITDSIAMNYTATISSTMLKVATPQMTFERDGEIYGPVTGHPIAEGSNVYSFTYPDIMAQDMGQTIKATLTVGSQNKVYETSVLEYCEDVLKAESLEGYTDTQLTAAKALVVDLVQYGAAAQTYRGVVAEELHTAKIADWATYVTQYDSEDTTLDSLSGSDSVVTNKLIQEEGVEESTDYQWKSVTLVLGNKVKVRYRFTATSVYNLTVKLQVGDNEAVDVEYESTSEEGVYVFDFDNIYAYEYGTPITVRFYEGDTQVGATVNYSVNTYLYGMRNYNGSMAEELKALLLAIHNYGEAAQSYRDAE